MRIRKSLINGVEAFVLALLCHCTGADGAAIILFIISVGLTFGKIEKPPM